MSFLPQKREGCMPRRTDRLVVVRFTGERLDNPLSFRTQDGFDRWKERNVRYYERLRKDHPERGDLQPQVMFEAYALDLNKVTVTLLEAGHF